MKLLFLLPPSEWKNSEHFFDSESLTYEFDKPHYIAENATEKDLKCSWKRFEEGIELNKSILKSWTSQAIKRYSWVMYNSIDYEGMSDTGKKFFEDNFAILSWMYWKVAPLDKIWDYKLPIETKGLYKFWWETISEKIVSIKPDYIVNLLPISYAKMIWIWGKKVDPKLELIFDAGIKLVNINFLKTDWKKVSHWVKSIKWEWIKNICENTITDINNFWWEVQDNWNVIDINIITKK